MSGRGFTWSEAHRHACEVRHVLAMPTRQRRADYIAGVAARRGQAASEQLAADVAAAWHASRGPSSPTVGPAAPAASGVHLGVNSPRTTSVPSDGSFLAPAAAGSSDPDSTVDSGGGGR